ncbi:MAG TPA: ribbon-helix-helix protein, CopG family [Coleofasciculaceae cyanobacterium]|jgi:metal-responsive CopG/Arc/MetJ family transcriptional regulator
MPEEKRTRVSLYLSKAMLAELDQYCIALGNESRNTVIRASLRQYFQNKKRLSKMLEGES